MPKIIPILGLMTKVAFLLQVFRRRSTQANYARHTAEERLEAEALSTARATSTEPVDLGGLMGSRRRAAAAGKAAAAAETGSASYGAAVGVEALLAAHRRAGAKRARSVIVEQLPRRSVRRPRTSGEARSSGQRASALHSLQGCAGCRTAEHSSATPRGCSAPTSSRRVGRFGGISPRLARHGYNRLPGGHLRCIEQRGGPLGAGSRRAAQRRSRSSRWRLRQPPARRLAARRRAGEPARRRLRARSRGGRLGSSSGRSGDRGGERLARCQRRERRERRPRPSGQRRPRRPASTRQPSLRAASRRRRSGAAATASRSGTWRRWRRRWRRLQREQRATAAWWA